MMILVSIENQNGELVRAVIDGRERMMTMDEWWKTVCNNGDLGEGAPMPEVLPVEPWRSGPEVLLVIDPETKHN